MKITSKKELNKRMEKLFEAIDESIKYEFNGDIMLKEYKLFYDT